MEQDIHVVRTGRLSPEDLHIQRVTQPGQRMPVGGEGTGECPFNRARGQSIQDVGIVVHVVVIVEVEEGMSVDRIVNRNRRDHQQQPEYPGPVHQSRERVGIRLGYNFGFATYAYGTHAASSDFEDYMRAFAGNQ